MNNSFKPPIVRVKLIDKAMMQYQLEIDFGFTPTNDFLDVWTIRLEKIMSKDFKIKFLNNTFTVLVDKRIGVFNLAEQVSNEIQAQLGVRPKKYIENTELET